MKNLLIKHGTLILALVTATSILFGSVIGYRTSADYEKEEAFSRLYNSMHMVFKGTPVIEYGQSFDPESLIEDYDGELTIHGEVDTNTTGQYTLTYSLSDQEEEFDQEVTRPFERVVVVKDTKAPEIEIESEEIKHTIGSELDIESNIVGVKDVVDGDLEKKEALEPGSYVIDGEVDAETAGEYPVTVKAMDINGNTSEASYTVVVKRRRGYAPDGYEGPILTAGRGTVTGPNGRETYYNLDMSQVVANAKRAGVAGEYWVRDDGAKMLGEYVLCACDVTGRVHRRYDIVKISMGYGICADTGGFASGNPYAIDIATNW